MYIEYEGLKLRIEGEYDPGYKNPRGRHPHETEVEYEAGFDVALVFLVAGGIETDITDLVGESHFITLGKLALEEAR
jgi:hypothetical protein